jgi:hypothetical protein
MGQSKRPLLNADPVKDWVTNASLIVAGVVSYNRASSDFIIRGNKQFQTFDLVASSIDVILSTAIMFFLFVGILGSIRRTRSNGEVNVLDLKETKFRKMKIALAIVVVSFVSLLAAYSNYGTSSVNAVDKGVQFESRCQPQGENELCISAVGAGEFLTFNFELTYKVPQDFNGFQVSSSTWELARDCKKKTLSAIQLKFLDINKIEIPIEAGVLQTALQGIETDYAGILKEC